jgi:hypothetical protein
MLFAIFIIAGHGIMPHNHYFENQFITHRFTHDHHKHSHGHAHNHYLEKHQEDDHRSVFSYLQLDEDFLPTQINPLKITSPFSEFVIVHWELAVNLDTRLIEVPKPYYRKYPPPKIIYSSIFSRPPPFQLIA